MKAILVDDEPLALDLLEYFLNRTGEVEIAGSFINPVVALENIMAQEPEVVFLDIGMPQISGLRIAELIIKMKKKTRIVFITGFDNSTINAIGLHDVEYVVKPFSQERVEMTVQKIRRSINEGYIH